MSKNNPGYYGILPADVRYDKNLKPMARILYAEISALSNATGDCTAGNKYFADLYEVSPTTVSEWISQLEAGGYVTTYVDHAAGNKRKIRIAIPKKPKTSSEKAEDPSSEKAEDNNTSINNNFNISKNGDKNPEEIEGTKEYANAKQRAAVYELYLKRYKVRDGVDLDRAKARYKLTPRRRAAIDRRLADAGYKMLCAAIIGYANEEWTHRGSGNRPGWEADLEEYICRTYEIVEAGANRFEEQQRNGGSSDDAWGHLK